MTEKFDELNEDARIVANIFHFFTQQRTSADVEEGNGRQCIGTSYASPTLVLQFSRLQTNVVKLGGNLELSFDYAASSYDGSQTR